MVSVIKEMKIRAIVHATESIEKVREAINTLSPNTKIREIHTTGYHGNEIVVLDASTADNCAYVEDMLRKNGIFEEVLRDPEVYINEGVIHLKFDKQIVYAKKKLVMGSTDTISVHIRIGSKSETREKTIERIRKFLRGEGYDGC